VASPDGYRVELRGRCVTVAGGALYL